MSSSPFESEFLLSSIAQAGLAILAFFPSNLIVVCSIRSTPFSITSFVAFGYKPAQYHIKVHAGHKISGGFLRIFFSKHLVFHVFQMAQKIATSPSI
jgi:hypothetical protein